MLRHEDARLRPIATVPDLANTPAVALLLDYTFVPIDNGDAFLDALNDLFGALQSNGQLWGPHVTGRVGGAFRVTCSVPRRDALAEQYGSQWVRESFEKVKAQCSNAPTWQVVDERPGSTRKWSDERELFLYTHLFDETSPVCAGSDGDPLPLYLLPIEDESRRALTRWMAQYKRYDHLQLDCGPLEVEGYRQLADPASELANEGRELARDVERATRLPTYYYLMRYWGWTARDEAERLCPGCGQPWKNPGDRTSSGLAWFDFRCEPCRLVSHIASSSDDADGHPQIGSFHRQGHQG